MRNPDISTMKTYYYSKVFLDNMVKLIPEENKLSVLMQILQEDMQKLEQEKIKL